MRIVSLFLVFLPLASCSNFSTALKLEHNIEKKVDTYEVIRNEKDDSVRE
jgi:hypothetical protein